MSIPFSKRVNHQSILILLFGLSLSFGCTSRSPDCEELLRLKITAGGNELLQFGPISRDYSLLLQEKIRIAKLSVLRDIPKLMTNNAINRSALSEAEDRIRKFSHLDYEAMREMFDSAERQHQRVYWVTVKTSTNIVTAYVLYDCSGEPNWIISSEDHFAEGTERK